MDSLVEIVPRQELRKRLRGPAATGCRVVDGFTLSESDWAAPRGTVCIGTVATERDVTAAVLAATRGASLVLCIELQGSARQRLLEDLGKVAVVEVATDDTTNTDPASLPPEIRRLIDALADGSSMSAAACAAGLSVRTAHRRLATLRASWSVSTNAQLLQCVPARETDTTSMDAPDEASSAAVWLRNGELDRICAHLSDRRCVAVLGPAGSGKTTLLQLAAARIGGRAHVGGALGSLRWMPYLPLTRAVGSPPTGSDAAAMSHHVIEATGPGLLIIDDLHWADAATLQLLPQIAAQVLIVVGVRTGDPGTQDALEVLAPMRAVRIELEPLPPLVAREFARVRNPRLTEQQLDSLLDRAKGNPLFLDQLARDASPTLLASLVTRLDGLGDESRVALQRLSVLGRPADAHLLGEGADALVDAGLAFRADGLFHPQHQLLCDEVLGQLTTPQRIDAHRHVAEHSPPAEAARHFLAAGHAADALAAALTAAATAQFPGERARDLLLAADLVGSNTSREDDVGDALLAAVDAFLEAGETRHAQEILERIPDARKGEVELRRSQLLWQAGDPDGAYAAATAGLHIADGSRTALEVALRLEQLKHPIRVEFDGERGLPLATKTWLLASEIGAHEVRALTALGSAHLVAGTGKWEGFLDDAVERADSEVDPEVAFETLNAFVAAHMLDGDRAVARAAALHAAGRAREAGRRRWEEQFAITANFLAALSGRCTSVAVWGNAFVRPHLTTAVHLAYAAYALALADLGFGRNALRLLDEAGELDVGDETGLSLLLWVAAETHWLAGRPEEALVAAEKSIGAGGGHFPARPLAEAIRAWAEFDLGRTPTPSTESGWAFARAAQAETHGVAALAAGNYSAAAGSFDAAIGQSQDAPRFALRSRWGIAEAMRLAGEPDAAVMRFEAVARDATELGLRALAGRALRRLTGARRSGGNDHTGSDPLTPRQRQVIQLAGEGHTSKEIGMLIGVSTATVDSHIRSAMERLGAKTRKQAVLIAANDESPTARALPLRSVPGRSGQGSSPPRSRPTSSRSSGPIRP